MATLEVAQPVYGVGYEIIVQGYLAPRWADWFDDMTITRQPGGQTRLAGVLADQAALFGLLGKVRDLGLTLISVNSLP
jgi:hypothetical protein